MNSGSPERISVFPPFSLQLVTNIKKKQQTGGSLFSCVACLNGSSTGANVQLSECFQHHGQRNFIVYTLTGPRDSPHQHHHPPAAGSADVTPIDKNVGVEMALRV